MEALAPLKAYGDLGVMVPPPPLLAERLRKAEAALLLLPATAAPALAVFLAEQDAERVLRLGGEAGGGLIASAVDGAAAFLPSNEKAFAFALFCSPREEAVFLLTGVFPGSTLRDDGPLLLLS